MKKYVNVILVVLILSSCKKSNDNQVESQSVNSVNIPMPSSEEIAESSIENYNLILSRDPTAKVAYFGRGCSLMELHKYKEAIKNFSKALSLKSKEDIDFEILCHRADCKNFIRDYKGAISDYTKAINLDPIYRDPYSGRADSYLKIGRTNKALQDWQSLIDMGYTEYSDSISKYKK